VVRDLDVGWPFLHPLFRSGHFPHQGGHGPR